MQTLHMYSYVIIKIPRKYVLLNNEQRNMY